MRIATSNEIYKSNDITLTTGTLLSGENSNITRSNFSQNATYSTSGNAIVFNYTPSINNIGYVSLHGVKFKNASIGSTVTVSLFGSTTKSITLNSDFSDLMFTFDTPVNFSNITIRIDTDAADEITVSYFSAGSYTDVPFGGARGGQIRPYLIYNQSVSGTQNSLGTPTRQAQRQKANRVNLNFPKLPQEWVRNDFIDVLSLYNKTGIVSILDFEAENRPTECYAAFELMNHQVKIFDGTQALIPLSFSFKASNSCFVRYP